MVIKTPADSSRAASPTTDGMPHGRLGLHWLIQLADLRSAAKTVDFRLPLKAVVLGDQA